MQTSLTPKSQEYLSKIEILLEKINAHRPLSKDEILEIQKWFTVSYTYNTNAIEGNTLTLPETKILLEDGITVGGKPIKEIYEAMNHKEALLDVYNHITKKTKLSENFILKSHEILMQKILEKPGRYRDIQVYISGSEEILPTPKKVPELMNTFIKEYNEIENKNPILQSIFIHWSIAKIHPFLDGNGRIARLMMNFELLQNNIPPVIIPLIRRQEYISSCNTFEKHIEFLLDITHENCKDYLRMIAK